MSRSAPLAPTILPLPAGLDSQNIILRIDPWIAGSAVALLSIGTVMVYSATAVRAYASSGASSAFLVQHLISLFVGLLCLGTVLRVPVALWSRYAYLLLALTLVLLGAVHVPGLGHRVNGALRWLVIGPFRFQPAELAKLAVVVYLAHSLAKKRDQVRTFGVGFLPHALVVGLIGLLILFQPDLGTCAIIIGVLGTMMFVAGTRLGYLVAGLLAISPLAIHYVASRPHAFARLRVFMDPESHKQNLGYQIWESLVSFGSGGAFGAGLGQGRQKLFFLPEAHSDFVFAVVGEEAGFFGVVVLLTLFAILLARGIRAALLAEARFPTYLAFGICSWIGLQVLINMAVVLALIPTKGLTLPLVSFGGSSQIASLIGIGILLRISAEENTKLSGAGPREAGARA